MYKTKSVSVELTQLIHSTDLKVAVDGTRFSRPTLKGKLGEWLHSESIRHLTKPFLSPQPRNPASFETGRRKQERHTRVPRAPAVLSAAVARATQLKWALSQACKQLPKKGLNNIPTENNRNHKICLFSVVSPPLQQPSKELNPTRHFVVSGLLYKHKPTPREF